MPLMVYVIPLPSTQVRTLRGNKKTGFSLFIVLYFLFRQPKYHPLAGQLIDQTINLPIGSLNLPFQHLLPLRRAAPTLPPQNPADLGEEKVKCVCKASICSTSDTTFSCRALLVGLEKLIGRMGNYRPQTLQNP